ncbi:MAG: hypothetical protein R2748_06235 [Bryobacterales bacterium]
MDGNNDEVSLPDYRYALDAVRLDYLLISEHNSRQGPDQPYINWMLQQAVDVFSVTRVDSNPSTATNVPSTTRTDTETSYSPSAATPLCRSPRRSVQHEKSAALCSYLKERDGIAISHTSASNMGTDWRDNDPDVEPLVEIFQGDRVSAEYEGAPWAAWSEDPASAPGGFRPLRLRVERLGEGLQAGRAGGQRPLSTHMSYACAG